MRRIALLVEGDGDKIAVPMLPRRVLADISVFDIDVISPSMVGNHQKLLRFGEFEKYIRYARNLKEASAILLVQDCDDGCAVSLAEEISRRFSTLQPSVAKKFEISLLVREYESYVPLVIVGIDRAFSGLRMENSLE